MRRIVIITVVMISSVVTTFFVSDASYKTGVSKIKVSKTDFSANTLIAGKSYIATAD